MCFKYDLSPVWSALTLLFLLGLSIFEDSFLIDQANMPEGVMVVSTSRVDKVKRINEVFKIYITMLTNCEHLFLK